MRFRALLGLLVTVALAAGPSAQGAKPVSISQILERPVVTPGGTLLGALRIEIPPELHLQSNVPRDPSLIPTVITFDPPADVTAAEVVFPATIDFKIAGFDAMQAVFEKT